MIDGPTRSSVTGQMAPEHAARYEALRCHVIEHSVMATREGLAVLLRQGVGAWMEAWSMLPAPPTRSCEAESTRPWPVAEGLTTEVVRVLVAMTLGHIQEVQA